MTVWSLGVGVLVVVAVLFARRSRPAPQAVDPSRDAQRDDVRRALASSKKET